MRACKEVTFICLTCTARAPYARNGLELWCLWDVESVGDFFQNTTTTKKETRVKDIRSSQQQELHAAAASDNQAERVTGSTGGLSSHSSRSTCFMPKKRYGIVGRRCPSRR